MLKIIIAGHTYEYPVNTRDYVALRLTLDKAANVDNVIQPGRFVANVVYPNDPDGVIVHGNVNFEGGEINISNMRLF